MNEKLKRKIRLMNEIAMKAGSLLDALEQMDGDQWRDTGYSGDFPVTNSVARSSDCWGVATTGLVVNNPKGEFVSEKQRFRDHVKSLPDDVRRIAVFAYDNPKCDAVICGENTVEAFRSYGCRAVITDGPVRDWRAISGSACHVLANSRAASHRNVDISHHKCKVTINGLTIDEGDTLVTTDGCVVNLGAWKDLTNDFLSQLLAQCEQFTQRDEASAARSKAGGDGFEVYSDPKWCL